MWGPGGGPCTSAAKVAAPLLRPIQRVMPQPSGSPFVSGLVLAAGGSSRLGRPKQLLPYGDGTLLEHVVKTACSSPIDQLIVAGGGRAPHVLGGRGPRGAAGGGD